MKNISIKELIDYWQATAEHDYKTMLSLFKSKRYSASLFFGHIILEKILKGLVVKETKNNAPKIHDLVRLANLAKLDLSIEIVDYLEIVNRFNMRARYPDVKFQFYKSCDRQYSANHINQIKKLYQKLCQSLKQKK